MGAIERTGEATRYLGLPPDADIRHNTQGLKNRMPTVCPALSEVISDFATPVPPRAYADTSMVGKEKDRAKLPGLLSEVLSETL